MGRFNAVFIPGLLNDERLWYKQVQNLSDILISHVADITSQDNISDLADSVLQKAPEQFILIGLSMGGYVALEIMRKAPQRVIGLALFDTNARADTPEGSSNRRVAIEQSKTDFASVVDDFIPKILYPQHLDNIEIVNLIHEMADEVGKDKFYNQQTAIINRIDSRPFLKNIECQTLIACGADDKLTPVDMHEEMHQLIPHSTLKTIENCGHLSALEKPFEVSDLIRDFVNSLTSPKNVNTVDKLQDTQGTKLNTSNSNDASNPNNGINLQQEDFSNSNNSNNHNENYVSNQNTPNPASISNHKNNYNMQTNEYGNSRNSDINKQFVDKANVEAEEKS